MTKKKFLKMFSVFGTWCGIAAWIVLIIVLLRPHAEGDTLKPLEPNTFAEWTATKILTPQSYVWIIAANPDLASTIRAVAMAVRPENMRLIEYKYFENSEPRSFSYSFEKEKFIETELTPEQRAQCLECHKYGQGIREVSSGDAG